MPKTVEISLAEPIDGESPAAFLARQQLDREHTQKARELLDGAKEAVENLNRLVANTRVPNRWAMIYDINKPLTRNFINLDKLLKSVKEIELQQSLELAEIHEKWELDTTGVKPVESREHPMGGSPENTRELPKEG